MQESQQNHFSEIFELLHAGKLNDKHPVLKLFNPSGQEALLTYSRNWRRKHFLCASVFLSVIAGYLQFVFAELGWATAVIFLWFVGSLFAAMVFDGRTHPHYIPITRFQDNYIRLCKLLGGKSVDWVNANSEQGILMTVATDELMLLCLSALQSRTQCANLILEAKEKGLVSPPTDDNQSTVLRPILLQGMLQKSAEERARDAHRFLRQMELCEPDLGRYYKLATRRLQ